MFTLARRMTEAKIHAKKKGLKEGEKNNLITMMEALMATINHLPTLQQFAIQSGVPSNINPLVDLLF